MPGQGATELAKISFLSAAYLGGLPGASAKKKGNLIFTDDRVGLGIYNPKHCVIMLLAIESIDIGGREVATSKFGSEVLFGLAGALGARGERDETWLTIRTSDGSTVFFLIDGKAPIEVAGMLSSWMTQHGIPSYAAAQQSELVGALTSAGGVPPHGDLGLADELGKLAKLRDQGALSDDEFALAKTRLLGKGQ